MTGCSGCYNGDFTFVFTFNNVISNCGTSTNGTVSAGPNPTQCTLQATGLPNAQYSTVQITGVTDNNAKTVDAAATVGVLLGDVNASGRVDSADVTQVRQQSLQTITTSNFRNDINETGRIDSADVTIARQQALTSLP